MTSDSYVLAAAYAVEAALRDLETAQRLLRYSPEYDKYIAALQGSLKNLQSLQDALAQADVAPGSVL